MRRATARCWCATLGGKRQTIKVRLSDLIKDGDIDQNVAMLPGDTLIIPQAYF